ncbi:MAG TPA: nucleotidyltransferase [Vicinamibacterales bacterium]|nr:nucleotidyltransferase [Vicinamibacterales bacterium]
MNRDFAEMLSALSEAGAEFLVVGAHALAAHGKARATGDLDIWVNPTPANAEKVMRALTVFGAPLHDLTIEDLTASETVFQIGVVPCRIDILSGISGVRFDNAWQRRLVLDIEGVTVPVLSREDFVANKLASNRAKDRVDLELLGE